MTFFCLFLVISFGYSKNFNVYNEHKIIPVDTNFHFLNVFFDFNTYKIHHTRFEYLDSLVNAFKKGSYQFLLIEAYQQQHPESSQILLKARLNTVLDCLEKKGIPKEKLINKSFKTSKLSDYRLDTKGISELEIEERHKVFATVMFFAFIE